MPSEKLFPIQRRPLRHSDRPPHPVCIPWSVAELAYSVYGHSQTLERIAERGGFGAGEMDTFLPDWIERCNEITQLKAEVERLTACLDLMTERGELWRIWQHDGNEWRSQRRPRTTVFHFDSREKAFAHALHHEESDNVS